MNVLCSLPTLVLASLLAQWSLQAQAQQPQPLTVNISAEKGEICVQGVIQSVDPKRGSFVLAVSAVYPPGGSKVAFAVPRPKTVLINAKTTVQEPDMPGKVPALSDLSGLGAIVSGLDAGTGSTLPARQVVLWLPGTDAHVQAGGEDTEGTPPHYSITDIGTLPGDIESDADGLNDKGEVVGQSISTHTDDGQDVGHGFVWKAGQMYDLGVTYGYHSSVAFRINNAGRIVGTVDNYGRPSTLRTISRGCWWQSGAIHVLSLNPSAIGSLAFGINAHGTTVGMLNLPLFKGTLAAHAALWRDGRLTDLGILPGFPSASASGINGLGDVVCNSERFETVESQVRLLSRAYLWHNGQKTNIGVLPGCNSSRVNAINSNGEIIGQCSAETFAHAISPQQGFVWQNHHMTELKGLEGSVSSSPFGINDQGDIVGIGDSPPPGSGTEAQIATDFPTPDLSNADLNAPKTRAVLWRAGRAYDLSRFLQTASGWQLTIANAVNNRGQIVGHGLHNGKKRGYLLTPLP